MLGMCAAIPAVHGAELPYAHDFSSGWGEMTVADGNDDGTKFILTYSGYNYTQGVAYTAPSDIAADEWLFTPVFNLEAGLTYEITFKAKSNSSNTTNELVLATGPEASVSAMEAVDGATLSLAYNWGSWSSHTFTYTATRSGEACFAFHLVSPAGQGSFYMDNIEVSAGVNGMSPTEVSVSAATHTVVGDKLHVAIDVTAPTATFSGNTLSDNVTLTATRSDNADFISSFEAAPGQIWNFVDTEGVAGNVTYTFTASNAAGTSAPVSVVSNPTVALPAAVSGLEVTTDGNGAFQLSWQPVTTPATSTGIFLPSEVNYTVSCNNSVLERGLSETSYEYTFPMPEEGQETVVFTVVANNSRGAGEKATSETFMCGSPYEGEFAESGLYANYRTSFDKKTWTIVGNASAWAASTGSSYSPVVNPQDSDGVLISYNARNGDALLLSPVLDLSGLQNPMLKFYLFHYPTGTASTIQAGFRTADGTDIMLGEPIVYNDRNKTEGWHEYLVAVPAEACSGTTRIIFAGISNGSYGSMFIDNISVKSYLADNLAVSGISVPKTVAIGESFDITATVQNKGVNAAKGYSLEFEIDGENAGTVTDTPEIEAQGTATVSLTVTAHPRHGGNTVNISVKAVYPEDLDMADNSAEAELPIEANEHPVATDLKGVAGKEGVTLTWSAPEVSTEPTVKTVFESFEDWEAYSTSAPEGSGWIFLDVDNSGQYGFNGHNGNTKFTAIVGEAYTPSYGNAFAPCDGTKALVFTKPYASSGNDNWVILPEVKGGTEFSFRVSATHLWNTLTDKIEVYYSMGSTDPEEFLRVARFDATTWTWTEHSFTVPAAARRVAFRTNGKMENDAIAVDAVSYCVEDAPLSLQGYNVYRNHEKTASVDAATTSYLDAVSNRADETRNYYVTAVYDKGESMPSASVDVDMSTGIDNVAADHNGISMTAADGIITVTGAEGMAVVIADAAGRTIFATAAADAAVSVKAASGIYIVRAGTKTVKVAL